MKKILSLIIVVLLTCAGAANAQKYVFDNYLNDSVATYPEGYDHKDESQILYLKNGDIVEITDTTKYGEPFFMHNGKKYTISPFFLLFSEDNPEGSVDILGDTRSEKQHSFLAHFFGSSTFLWIISIAMLLAVALMFLSTKISALRRAALFGTPVLLTIVAGLEALALNYIGDDVFWWCDSDRIGFFASLFTLIPYTAFVAFQLYVIVLYSALVAGGSGKKVSLWPMAISIGICIPVTLIAVIISSFIFDGVPEIVAIIAFFGSLGIGIYISFRRNIKELGFLPGLMFSIFGAVYFVGAVVAIYGLVIVVFKLILQIIIACACVAAVLFAGGGGGGRGGGGGGGGGSSSKTYWETKDGQRFDNEWDANRHAQTLN